VMIAIARPVLTLIDLFPGKNRFHILCAQLVN
jgi:hypothetical protein